MFADLTPGDLTAWARVKEYSSTFLRFSLLAVIVYIVLWMRRSASGLGVHLPTALLVKLQVGTFEGGEQMENGVVVRSEAHGTELRVWTLRQRPELAPQIGLMEQTWPEFMRHDMISRLYYGVAPRAFPEYVLLAAEVSNPDVVVAMGFAAPFRFPDNLPLNEQGLPEDDCLPEGGWDFVIREAALCWMNGETPNAVCALEVTIHPDFQGKGLSKHMLIAMRNNIKSMNLFKEMLVAVRPNRRGVESELVPMTDYVLNRRADLLPVDPWLRVHRRVGGRIAKVATRSMVISGTLEEWRGWTGLPFKESGPVVLNGGLVPVHVDVENNFAVYVEPNVWVRHSLGPDWGIDPSVATESDRPYSGHGVLEPSTRR